MNEPTSLAMFQAAMSDPAFRERMYLSALADTGNPYYVWRAIENCIVHKKEFPDWIVAYLAQCVQRMTSNRARESGDLRKDLPWIFGFPNLLDPAQQKRGPGNLLDPPDPGSPDPLFPLRFAIRLEQGERPVDAMRNACNDVFSEEIADKVDDKTLRRWLLKDFDLNEWPSNAEELKKICREHYSAHYSLLRAHWEETKSRETLG